MVLKLFLLSDTVVFVNLWYVLRNNKFWKDPKMFDPTRFLDDSGHVVHPKNLPQFLPFSTGRRACPGKALAEVELPFLLTNLVHEFEFASKALNEKKEIKVENGLSLKPVTFFVTVTSR